MAFNPPSSIENIILGVLANGLTALIAHVWRKGRAALTQDKNLRQSLGESTALVTVLQKATASIAKATKFDDVRQSEKLRFFLVSPDVEAIVRQLYASQLAAQHGHVESIRAEFLAALALRLGEPEHSLADFAEHLFDALLRGCERALTVAIDHGVLSAHEAKSVARHRLILDELAAIQKNLALLTAPHRPDIQTLLAFEQKYRQQVSSRHAHIIPPHFDAARKVPIDELYVPPDFVRVPQKRGEEPERLTMPDFLSLTYRAVLLGNPGGGKSTFTLKLCYDLATYYPQRLLAGRQVTPILVVLRNYGAEKKARSCSILQFIETTANAIYQIPPPPGVFEYLLLNGRAVVLFDGLDELLDTSYRQEISGDIESFCSLYPSVPVLVTSREVGYEQAPLDERRFELFRLADFNDEQVRAYARKWFAVDTELTPEQQQQKADAFFNESRIVPDLCANPLMLALMCNLYRGQNYIPRNRPDVYEKCSVMLFERWDKSRGLFVPLPFEAHISPAMKYLAHWIYADEQLQGGVTEERLVAQTTAYLCEWRFDDRDEAEKAARDFIEFCRGRAWVFTDTGTRREGERLYQFTHRTFLEYFTAAHLVRTHPTPAALGAVLWPRIARREWDIVAQLAFQLQHKNIEGAGDELLLGLVQQALEHEGDEDWHMLSFAARCLEFMVPRPKTLREIVTACIERSLAWGLQRVRFRQSRTDVSKYDYTRAALLGDLLHAASENRTIIVGSLEKLLIERINHGDEQESLLALEIGLHFPFPLYLELQDRVLIRELTAFWESASARIYDVCSDRIKALAQKHFGPCIYGFWLGKISPSNLVNWHGVDALFSEYRYSIFLGSGRLSLAEVFICDAIPNLFSPEHSRVYKNLKEVGRILLSSAMPWVSKSPSLSCDLDELLPDQTANKNLPEVLNPEPDALFGAFALCAATLETHERGIEFCQRIKESHIPLLDSLGRMLSAHFEHTETDRVQATMDHCGFTTAQQTFAWRWIRREVKLVR